jgi:phosphotransferase system HPr (HPr) family protein
MKSADLTIENPSGLHARPAALFVRTAGGFHSAIRVRNVTRRSAAVDAKSILSVIGIGVSRGHAIEVSADGADEDEAIDTIRKLVEGGVGETIE